MIKGDPIEPSRLELYYKQITMKYRENKSNITEQAKRNTGKETDRVYVDPVQRRARWKLVAVGGERSSTMDGGQRNWRGEDRQKLQKNTETDRKVIQQNTKQKLE
jgi:hypothetical protein